jgi:hypothetical protein
MLPFATLLVSLFAGSQAAGAQTQTPAPSTGQVQAEKPPALASRPVTDSYSLLPADPFTTFDRARQPERLEMMETIVLHGPAPAAPCPMRTIPVDPDNDPKIAREVPSGVEYTIRAIPAPCSAPGR